MTTTNPVACIACGATDTETNRGTYPVETIDGHPMCFACYYNGSGYAHIRRPLIEACERHGIDLRVWQTGGGCQNYAVTIDGDIDVLLGDATEPLADTYLAPCIYVGDDYAEQWTNTVGHRITPPDTRTIDNVAQWVADIITDITTNRENQ